MAENSSIIGRTTQIRGRVTGAVDLQVQGLVDGEITVDGDVTVDTEGLVGASIRGRRVVVRGCVKGDLLGHEAVVLEDGARVVGDVKAPRIAIATGAMVRGFVETGDARDAVPKDARAQPAARPVARPVAVPPRLAPPVASPSLPVAAIAKPAAPPAPAVHASATSGSDAHASIGPRRPPPPVVPSLKKVKGQIAKKKER